MARWKPEASARCSSAGDTLSNYGDAVAFCAFQDGKVVTVALITGGLAADTLFETLNFGFQSDGSLRFDEHIEGVLPTSQRRSMTRIGSTGPRFGLNSQDQTSQANQRLLARFLELKVIGQRANGGNSTDSLDLTLSRIYRDVTGHASTADAALSAGLGSGDPVVIAANAAQVSRVDVVSLTSPTSISGSVVQAADQGELQLAGDSAGNVEATASFRLSGGNGSATIAVTEGESLDSVAIRVNQDVDATGIYAFVDKHNLVLRSDEYGSDASVAIQLLDIESDIAVGSNLTQVSGVQPLTVSRNKNYSLSGSVTQAAELAELVYRGGAGGVVSDTATFTLTGDSGQTSITITKDESLADVASRVNALTGDTGVTAVQSGEDLLLQSVAYGSQADVSVEIIDIANTVDVSGVNAAQIESFSVGSFVLSGQQTFDGSVTQAASTAELTYTGFLGRTVSNATFTVTGSIGSAGISVASLENLTSVRDKINQASGTTGVSATVSGNELVLTSQSVGSAETVAVNVTSGSFAVSGGNGDGTANGVDAEATVNGQSLTAAGNDFSFEDAKGTYQFTSKDGFVGEIDTISVAATIAGEFDLTGGDGNGNASGVDATATFNGTLLTGNGNAFTVADSGGTFSVVFADAFSGAYDDITITTTDKPFSVSGGNGQGFAQGSNGTAIINGQRLTGLGNEYSVSTESGDFVLEFSSSFVGAFDSLEVTPGEDLSSAETNLLELQSQLFQQFDLRQISRGRIRQIESVVIESLDYANENPEALAASLLSGNFASLYGRRQIAELLTSGA